GRGERVRDPSPRATGAPGHGAARRGAGGASVSGEGPRPTIPVGTRPRVSPRGAPFADGRRHHRTREPRARTTSTVVGGCRRPRRPRDLRSALGRGHAPEARCGPALEPG